MLCKIWVKKDYNKLQTSALFTVESGQYIRIVKCVCVCVGGVSLCICLTEDSNCSTVLDYLN